MMQKFLGSVYAIVVVTIFHFIIAVVIIFQVIRWFFSSVYDLISDSLKE